MELGLDPGTFWNQSPASFAAALRGRIAARQQDYELALYGAWQGERFARIDKLKGFSTYLKESRKTPARKPSERQTPGEMLAAFQNIAGAGVALKIERISRS